VDYLRGIAIVLGFDLAGELLHRVGIPIPSGVLGLLAFYLALTSGLVKLKWVEGVSSLLLRHMVLLFVPLTVGLMEMGPMLSRQAVAITASLVVSLLAVFLTTGLLGKWLLPPEPVLPGLALPELELEDDAAQKTEPKASR
jgi:holin-like protein